AHAPLPDYFVEAYDVDPLTQLKLQSQLQAHVDQSISKTINFPANASFGQCRDVFVQAYRLGLKGCTMFRANPATGAVLSPAGKRAADSACP
ncbi:MAG TPA: ribonucleoside-diphosphate reductase, adenosylcobalamin-dependent, partial [Oxalobacteraceae bacterium]|nr:ribonucleoside-diphosphate reductase, adenosylcobalamin-dependent [Oxalobacteraceae bacterium]